MSLEGRTILWVENGLGPDGVTQTKSGDLVLGAQSIAQAEQMQAEYGPDFFDGVVVNPLAPQAGWREGEFLQYPGREWARDISGVPVALMGVGGLGEYDLTEDNISSVVAEMF